MMIDSENLLAAVIPMTYKAEKPTVLMKALSETRQKNLTYTIPLYTSTAAEYKCQALTREMNEIDLSIEQLLFKSANRTLLLNDGTARLQERLDGFKPSKNWSQTAVLGRPRRGYQVKSHVLQQHRTSATSTYKHFNAHPRAHSTIWVQR